LAPLHINPFSIPKLRWWRLAGLPSQVAEIGVGRIIAIIGYCASNHGYLIILDVIIRVNNQFALTTQSASVITQSVFMTFIAVTIASFFGEFVSLM
jgi:hypothetical protein